MQTFAAQGAVAERAARRHTCTHGEKTVGSAVNGRGRKHMQGRAHERHGSCCHGGSCRRHDLTHRVRNGPRNVQRVQGKGYEGSGGHGPVDAHNLPRSRTLIVDGGHAPDEPHEGEEDNKRVQFAVLGERSAEENALSRASYFVVRLFVEQQHGLFRELLI